LAAGSNLQTVATDFNGMAPSAKIAFDDISANGESLTLPDDLNSGLFPHAHAAGARIHSISWGSDVPSYDLNAMEMDEFMYDHDDYLILVAAGNSGPGDFTIVAPSTAKNILSVGSSLNSHLALAEYGELLTAVGVVGADGSMGARYRLQPALFGALIVLGGSKWRGRVVVAAPLNACSSRLSNAAAVSGQIALIQRGTCYFGTKALRAQEVGAVGVIIFNNVAGLVQMSPGDMGGLVTIPAGFISSADGTALMALVQTTAVEVSFPEEFLDSIPGEGEETMNRLSDFSSRGPTSDLRFKPDVVCPGESIRSAKAGVEQSVQCGPDCLLEMSGTSMATPNCAGASALVRQYFREGFHISGSRNVSDSLWATSALIKAMMIQSGRPVFFKRGAGYSASRATPDFAQGYGRVDLSSVLRFGRDAGFNLSVWNNRSLSDGEFVQFCVVVPASAPSLRVTIVWTDPPSNPGTTRALINDLDLTITESNSESFYFGNSEYQWDETHGPHPVRDSTNNVEQVKMTNTCLRFCVLLV
jgi:subtilisin family serine protease